MRWPRPFCVWFALLNGRWHSLPVLWLVLLETHFAGQGIDLPLSRIFLYAAWPGSPTSADATARHARAEALAARTDHFPPTIGFAL